MSKYFNPVKIFWGNNAINEILDEIEEYKQNKVLIITFANEFLNRNPLKNFLGKFNDKKIIIFSGSNPSTNDLVDIINAMGDFIPELIICVGGGSILDISKGIKGLLGKKITVDTFKDDILNLNILNKDNIKLLMVPTTSGTGSEATSWATFWDFNSKIKYSISDEMLYPDYALLLPELTYELPITSTISTTLDALCHATESYWANKSNEISRIFSLKAIKDITHILKFEDISLPKSREKLLLASTISGFSFSQTKTTACHSISYPLTMVGGINHGIAVALTLGSIFSVNYSKIIDGQDLLDAYGFSNPEEIQTFISGILIKYSIPHKLSLYGIKKEDLELIADYSFTKGRMDNNPVELSKTDVLWILNKIF